MKLTPLYHNNKISNSTLVYKEGKVFETLTLWQTKVFATIVFGLQSLVEIQFSGKKDIPEEITFDSEDSTFVLKIDLSKFVSPQNYQAAYEAIEKLQSGFKIILPSKFGKHREEISMIILSVDRPLLNNKYKDSTVLLKVAKKAALAIADIKIQNGKRGQFTRWYYEVTMNATSKYTQKFYWLISAWKHEKEFRTTVDKLKEELGIADTELKNFSDFKREVLRRIEKDLRQGDICIDLEKGTEYLKEVRGRKIVKLIFKIFKHSENNHSEDNLYVWHIISTLRKSFNFKDSHIEDITPTLLQNSTANQLDRVIEKLAEINNNYRMGKIKVKSSLEGYIIQSVKNLFNK